MLKSLFFCLVALLGSVLNVGADEESLVVLIDKPVEVHALRSAGMLYLADLDDRYLAVGDAPAVFKLASTGIRFSQVTTVAPGEDLYLLKPKSLAGEIAYAGAFFDVGRGQCLTKVATPDIDDLKLVPFSKVRLTPRMFESRYPGPARLRAPALAVTPEPAVEAMVADVSQDTLSKYISQMSGREPVMIGGNLDTLLTRYSYSWRYEHAAQYLYERFQDYGIDVDYHYYTICTFDFYSVDFVDANYGWAVGSNQKIFRTRDGGLTWEKQVPGAPNQSFWGVSFVDTLEGWIAGTGGRIYHTTDGGASWTQQTSGTTASLREIFFLDSLNGWVVGYAGKILRTTNGGATWTSVASGVTGDLYGLHFQSAARGWACGIDGKILYWNGTSWTPQTSGTTEYLLDVHFGDDNTGWVVGGGWTVLKTTDGGQNWVAQTVSTDVSAYFKGACFVDSLEGWVVGLSGGVIHTGDGGATWDVQTTGTLFGLRWVRFVNADDGWAVGYGGTVLHTADGGANWESQRENLPATALTQLKNVVATKPGTTSAEQVIICGHFDSTSPDPYNRAPGADDNASGTAAAVEAARVMRDYAFKKTVKFCAWSGEEQGLYGSGEYAGDAKGAGDQIVGVVNFDMIGYVNPSPEDIDVIGNAASEWLVDFTIDCATAYVPSLLTLKTIDASVSGSDHYQFWNAGYDAILAIEDRNLSYPFYHTVNDTLGNLTMPFATDVTKMGVATVAELAEVDTVASIAGRGTTAFFTAVSPNPSTGSARISFALGHAAAVRVAVVDVRGRVVRTLHSGHLGAGRHDIVWDGLDSFSKRVSSGIYFTKVETPEGSGVGKLVVLR